MRSRLLLLSGLLLLALALALHMSNEGESARAERSCERVLVRLQQQASAGTGPDGTEPEQIEVGDSSYIGTLMIPCLGLELPVQSEWDAERLKDAPCRFHGSADTGDLVVMAHNYRTHFGPIRRLKKGDEVCFTDTGGQTTRYLVAATATVGADEREAVTSGEHELTLFTCTYGGQSRVVVYCDAVP